MNARTTAHAVNGGNSTVARAGAGSIRDHVPVMSDQFELGEGRGDTGRDAPDGGDRLERDSESGADQDSAAGLIRQAIDGAEGVVESMVAAGGRLGELTKPVVRRVRPTVRAAVRRWREREAARIRRLRSSNREPLPNLYEVYPEASLAPLRELGLQTIPIADIRGTAVQGPVQRGRDFLPPPRLRTPNWVARWQRIRKAMDRLTVLPPIEVLKTAEGYWVVDGHNRVGAALYGNQVAIDALVTAVRLPGEPVEAPSGSLAAMLSESGELQAAGRGWLTRGASLDERRFGGAGEERPGKTGAAADTERPPEPDSDAAAGDPDARAADSAAGPGPEAATSRRSTDRG